VFKLVTVGSFSVQCLWQMNEHEHTAPLELYLTGETEVLGEKTIPVSLCPQHIPRELLRYRWRLRLNWI